MSDDRPRHYRFYKLALPTLPDSIKRPPRAYQFIVSGGLESRSLGGNRLAVRGGPVARIPQSGAAFGCREKGSFPAGPYSAGKNAPYFSHKDCANCMSARKRAHADLHTGTHSTPSQGLQAATRVVAIPEALEPLRSSYGDPGARRQERREDRPGRGLTPCHDERRKGSRRGQVR